MKKIKSFLKNASFIGTAVLLAPSAVMAQASWWPTSGFGGDMDELIRLILNTLIIVAAVAAVIYLVFNGFKYMTSSGDATKTEEAQKGIANALIGLIICIAAAVIVNFLLGRLGLEPEDVESMLGVLVA